MESKDGLAQDHLQQHQKNHASISSGPGLTPGDKTVRSDTLVAMRKADRKRRRQMEDVPTEQPNDVDLQAAARVLAYYSQDLTHFEKLKNLGCRASRAIRKGAQVLAEIHSKTFYNGKTEEQHKADVRAWKQDLWKRQKVNHLRELDRIHTNKVQLRASRIVALSMLAAPTEEQLQIAYQMPDDSSMIDYQPRDSSNHAKPSNNSKKKEDSVMLGKRARPDSRDSVEESNSEELGEKSGEKDDTSTTLKKHDRDTSDAESNNGPRKEDDGKLIRPSGTSAEDWSQALEERRIMKEKLREEQAKRRQPRDRMESDKNDTFLSDHGDYLAKISQLLHSRGNGEGDNRSQLKSGTSEEKETNSNNSTSSNPNHASNNLDLEGFIELNYPKVCYTCKAGYVHLHFHYDQLCPPCARLNWHKRHATAPLQGHLVLLTGSRVKIGFECGLKLLRCGATVIATSRFPHDTAKR